MKRWTILVLAFVLPLCGTIWAGEGMWQPKQLPDLAKKLKAAGLQLDPATLTDLTEHPMNAVIDLAGCSASFVSPKALVITNHHCSWGTLQYNSTPENDLRKDGFLANTLDEEIPAAPGSRVRVTVEVTDVTDKVTGGLEASLSGAERVDRIEARQQRLIAACEEYPAQRCRGQGVVLVYGPGAECIYPEGSQTWVDVAELTRPLCGQSRPGHFRGVTTIDIMLPTLQESVGSGIVSDRDFAILTASGQYVYSTIQSEIMERTVFDMAREIGRADLAEAAAGIVSGGSGVANLRTGP